MKKHIDRKETYHFNNFLLISQEKRVKNGAQTNTKHKSQMKIENCEKNKMANAPNEKVGKDGIT
jgi:hypothetical protein